MITATAGLARALEFDRWANRRLLDALDDQPHSGALAHLAHLLVAQDLWLRRLRQQPSPPGLELFPTTWTVAQCRALQAALEADWAAYLPELADVALDLPVAYRTTEGTAYTTGRADILSHIALHGTHHRAQANQLLRQDGRTPPVIDLIVFARSAV